MNIYSIAVSFVLIKLTYIDITTFVPEYTLSMNLIESPLTFIDCTCRPLIDSVAVS